MKKRKYQQCENRSQKKGEKFFYIYVKRFLQIYKMIFVSSSRLYYFMQFMFGKFIVETLKINIYMVHHKNTVILMVVNSLYK